MVDRFGRIALGLGLCSYLVVAVPAHAEQKEIRLKPASNWLVDWADNNCTLSRKFGTKDAPFLLTMRAYGRGYLADIFLAGPNVSAFQRPLDITVAYGAVQPRKIRPQYAMATGYGPAIIFSDPSLQGGEQKDPALAYRRPDPAWGGVDTPVTIANPHQILVLEASGLQPALAALGKCADDLIKQWGLDPEVQASLSRYPKPQNQGSWIVRIQNSFPSELLTLGSDARVNVRVIVDEAGRPEQCVTAQAFDNVEFKESTCRIIRESARFSPALDAGGKPVRSFYTTTIIYRQ